MFSFRTTPLEDQVDKALMSGRVGCFCTQNCWDTGRSRYMYDLFRERRNLARVFYPREAELTPGTNHIDFTREDLEPLNAIVVEIQDVGARYFNYTKDVISLMDILADMGEYAPALYIVDHINPAGRVVEGTMPEGMHEMHIAKVAHRHGLTLGELCNLYYSGIQAKFPLHVISYRASDSNSQLMPWTIAPASDIPGLFTCMMYSGGGLWNNTTITPGIGTSRPYEYIGAPFIKNSTLETPPVPQGAMMRPCTFTPSAGRYSDQRCYGWQIMLSPGAEYHSLLHTIQLMRWFMGRYSQFELLPEFWAKLADPVIAEYLSGGDLSLMDVREHVKISEQKWIRKAKRFCLYDDQPFRMK
ncbi:MAG: DUF1343 domain-containing protein [Bacteroidales bacterium]|nr:DUF1343 domain-containing protein [Bacteroidales bacterium]